MEYNQDQYAFGNSRFIATFLNILEVKEICSFRLVLEWKTRKEIPDSSRLEILEKFSGSNFTLSDAEDKTSSFFFFFLIGIQSMQG